MIFKRRNVSDTDDTNVVTKGETINDTIVNEDSMDEKICRLMQDDSAPTYHTMSDYHAALAGDD